MPEPVCMGGAVTCAELWQLLNSGLAIGGTVAVLLALTLGALLVRLVTS